MRKIVVILGLILLIIPSTFIFAGGMRTPVAPDVTDERPMLGFGMIFMILPFIPGIIITIVGVVLSPSKKEGNGFRMGY